MDGSTLSTLTSPIILFFVLGMIAALVRSDLAIPEAVAKGLSIYLMIAIGLKGGIAVAKSGVNGTVLTAAGAGMALSFALPVLAFAALRWFGRLDRLNAGAVAAHYGSVSVVTFVTALDILTDQGMPPAGYMVAVLAVMETPAIVSGLLLARSGTGTAAKGQADEGDTSELWHEVFLNASVVLLVGSFVIGMIAGPQGFKDIQPMFESGFKGALCLFLLDMGLIAARRLRASRAITIRIATLAIAMPMINGAIGVLVGHAIGLELGSVAALGVLCASASYIAVPAAMRMALPQADPGIYLTMSLSLTFPFNILFGIGLVSLFARYLAGA